MSTTPITTPITTSGVTPDAAPAPTSLPTDFLEPGSVAELRAAVAPILTDLAATARGREGTRDYPRDLVHRLARAGITLVPVAREDGGAGGTLRDALDLVIAIARADASVAQSLRGSILTGWNVAADPEAPHRDRTLERLRRGHLFSGTTNERGGAAGSIATRLRRTPEGARRIDGEKYYSTGSQYADWFGGTAVDDDGEVVRFQVPITRAGVELVDDFDAVGQRLTASGTTRFVDVEVFADELSQPDDRAPRHPWLGSAAQLYLAAVEAGIAAAALDDALWFTREVARPIKHSSSSTAVDDPYVRHTVGEIAARAQAARAVVLLAAETLGELPAVSDEEIRARGADAAITVAQAQVVAVESALKAGELLFDVGGGTATDRGYALDRHWRNARTVANHNPRTWKAAIAGGWLLAGEEPPTTGLF